MANEKLVYNELEKDEEECFRKYFTTPNRNGYVKCEGCILPKYFINIGDRIKKMDIRDDDTWVCSFPKTGTTWAQEMVWCIGNDLNFKAAETLLPLRFPFLERSSLFDNEQLLADHPDITVPPHALDSVGYISNLPSPRFIKTHLPFNLLPEKLQNGSTSAKIIYVARNPRDTCVSYYHHSRLLEGYKGSFEQFAELFLNGNVNFGSFFNHVKGYWQSRNSSKILHLKYEEMKKDLKSVIHITADFMGKTLDKDRVEELLDHLSFSNMKQNKAVNYEGAIRRSRKINSIDEDAAFIRKGQIGEWKEIMNSNLCENFKKIEEEYSREIDYVFST